MGLPEPRPTTRSAGEAQIGGRVRHSRRGHFAAATPATIGTVIDAVREIVSLIHRPRGTDVDNGARSPRGLLTLTLYALLAGCIPYTVGSTARTVAPGERTSSVSTYLILNGMEDLSDSTASRTASLIGVDNEIRFGLDRRSDVGVRVPNLSGIVLTYKRRLDAVPTDEAGSPRGYVVALMPGLGFVNFGEHAHFELTMLASAPQDQRLLPYGGMRVMQVLPLSSTAVRDTPTAGVFAGLRIGTADQGVSPELGIYYDRSALDLRSSTVIVVPSLTVQGVSLRDLLF